MYVLCLQMHLFVENTYNVYAGKGLAKLGNIVAETLLLLMFPWVAKLGNICCGHKSCVRETKMFLTSGKNLFLFPSSKICYRSICFPRG